MTTDSNVPTFNRVFELLEQARTLTPESTPEGTVALAVMAYKVAGDIQSALDDLRKDAKMIITEVMAETEMLDYKSDAGRAYVSGPSVRVTYDNKALDVLCGSDAKLAAKLAPYRKVTEVAGSLTIK